MGDFSRTTSESFGRPEVWHVEVPIPGSGGQHNEVLQNFVDAVLDGKPLIAPAVEGIHSVELANSFVHSSVTGATVRLPLDAKAYAATLDGLIAANQGRVKKVSAVKASAADFAKSHGT
jgi:hypothetical protein